MVRRDSRERKTVFILSPLSIVRETQRERETLRYISVS